MKETNDLNVVIVVGAPSIEFDGNTCMGKHRVFLRMAECLELQMRNSLTGLVMRLVLGRHYVSLIGKLHYIKSSRREA